MFLSYDLRCNDKLTVLIDQHANRDSRHEKSVQKVLDIVLRLRIDVVRFFQLKNTLCHRLHDVLVSVPDFNQSLTESIEKK